MEFNSHEFLLFFLPSVIVALCIFSKQAQYIILFSSLIFYLWGSTSGLILLVASCVFVHYLRKLNTPNSIKVLSTIVLVIPFVFFRSSESVIKLFPALANLQANYPSALILPAGVSFYTFQIIHNFFLA